MLAAYVRSARRARLCLEVLEDRCTPAVFTVNVDTDTGVAGAMNTGELRWCLQQANLTPGNDTININNGLVIKLQSALPLILDTTTIQGIGVGGAAVDRDVALMATFRIFNIPAGRNVTISNLDLGDGIETVGGASTTRARWPWST